MIIIGITGKARSGKTSVANFLKQHIKRQCKIIAFADSLKDEVARACGVTTQHIELHKDVFRPMLQWWGTDYKRNNVSKDYWIQKVGEKILCETDNTCIIIPDVRFKNELEWVDQFDTGYTVKVVRSHGPTIPQSQHISETELADCRTDFIIDNSGTLEELEKQTVALIEQINETLHKKAQLK